MKSVYFWLLGVHLGSNMGPLSGRTSPDMIFGMSFDSLLTSARKRNESKKSQSLRSESMYHSTLKTKQTNIHSNFELFELKGKNLCDLHQTNQKKYVVNANQKIDRHPYS